MASTLATRLVTGIVLIAAILAALFLLPTVAFGVLVLLIVLAAGHEWARLIGLSATGRALFVAATLAAGVVLLWIGVARGFHPIVVAACGIATLAWIVIGVPAVLRNWQPASLAVRVVYAFVALEGAFVE